MLPETFLRNAIAPALRILPGQMDSRAARAMLIAVALQESRIEHRRQIGGPARGYWQFEQGGGVHGVLMHPACRPHIQEVLKALDYDPGSDEAACYAAIEHNDILAAAFARLLLWVLPGALPVQNAPASGWSAYVAAWHPGSPKRDTWDAFFGEAWDMVMATGT